MPDPKHVVCPTCDGDGYQSTVGAFTSSDMDEWYGGDTGARDEFVAEYTTPGGAYDEACVTCKGDRVITPARMAELAELAEYEAERAAEYRACGGRDW